MDNGALEKLRGKILSLQGISKKELDPLLMELERLEEQFDQDRFILQRFMKDKSIVINILRETNADLEKSKERVQEVNAALVKQQQKLIVQKKIIEENSGTLARRIKELKRSYEELEQFSYVASHDLKSPLRTISNFAQLLKRRYSGQLDRTADEYIEYIVSGTMQMHRIISDLLTYAQVGHRGETAEPVDLNEVLGIIRKNLHADIVDNQAVLQCAPLPVITSIRTYMLQLFQNLISNSIKFRSEKPLVIRIGSTKLHSDRWEFHVSDNGIGLAESFRDKAFFPFQRLSNQGKQGTGIGLAVCKKIVEIHQGNIRYEGNPEGGTTFVFDLQDGAYME